MNEILNFLKIMGLLIPLFPLLWRLVSVIQIIVLGFWRSESCLFSSRVGGMSAKNLRTNLKFFEFTKADGACFSANLQNPELNKIYCGLKVAQ